MSQGPLMPKATAVWLVDNTSLSFEQIADFCKLHPLEVKGIADGEVAAGIKGLDPISTGQLTREEIERAERDREAVARAVLLVQRHAALGERERLFVAMPQHHDARLVAADRGEHVVGVHHRRKPLGLPERGHRLVVAAELGERDARQ